MAKITTICCDFDGVIRDITTDDLIENTLWAIKYLEENGRKIVICTARKDLKWVNKWLKEHKINKKATNIKPKATVYLDNRGIRFTNWKDITSYF